MVRSRNLQEVLARANNLQLLTPIPRTEGVSVNKGAQTAIRQSGTIGFSAIPTLLVAAMPKCPICWMALMGALGVGSTINSDWLRPLAVTFLVLPVGALFVRARRRSRYGPFFLGLLAATVMYLCRFSFNYELGAYLSGAALVGASVWNSAPKRRPTDDFQCHC